MARLLRLNVHGVGVEIVSFAGASDETVAALAEDFGYFADIPTQRITIRLTLVGEPWGGKEKPRLKLFRTRACAVHQESLSRRRCDYGGGNAVQAEDGRPRTFPVHARDRDAEYELAYVALLSAIGEELDLRGFHRVHALGIELGGKAALVLLPRGGGKSAMALLGASSGAFRVYSDENPLVRDGQLHPYPIRAALAPEVAFALGIRGSSREFKRLSFPTKRLFPWEPDWIAREPRRVAKLLVGVRSSEEAAVEPLSRAGAVPGLAAYCVVGWGLSQMAEHMLRPRAAARLVAIACSRAREACRLGAGVELARFRVGRDARANLAALLRAV